MTCGGGIVTWIHVAVGVSRAERLISFVQVMITLLYLISFHDRNCLVIPVASTMFSLLC